MGIWYSPDKILGYNKLFNYIVGEKGVGKTYSISKLVISQFIKNRSQFVWLRRYDSELKTAQSLFTKLVANEEFGEHELKSNRAKHYFIDGEFAGKAVALSKALTEKGFGEFTDIKWIVFDEFIITSKNYHYIPNEVVQFLDFYETISRFREVRVIFLGNSASLLNPYFSYFKVFPDPKKQFVQKGEHVIEWCFNEEYRQIKKNSRFGELIKGTSYEAFAVDNDTMVNEKLFVEKRNIPAVCRFGIKWKGRTWYYWSNGNLGKGWLEETPDNVSVYSLTFDDHSYNTVYLGNIRQHFWWKMLYNMLQYGELRFSCIQAKKDFEEIWRIAG